MTEPAPTKTIRHPEPTKLERVQEDQARSPSSDAQQNRSDSSGPHASTGRKPLFRS